MSKELISKESIKGIFGSLLSTKEIKTIVFGVKTGFTRYIKINGKTSNKEQLIFIVAQTWFRHKKTNYNSFLKSINKQKLDKNDREELFLKYHEVYNEKFKLFLEKRYDKKKNDEDFIVPSNFIMEYIK